MMYHFMFGLRGASPLAAAPSRAGGCGGCSPPVASFFSSSAIRDASFWPANSFAFALTDSKSVRFEIIEQVRHAVLNEVINHRKVHGEDEDGDDHHGGRGLHFFPSGRGHLAHFGAHVVVENPDPVRPGFYGCYQRVLFGHRRHLRILPSSVTSTSYSSGFFACRLLKSGRGGGIRTPKFGFGDRQFNR